MVVRLIVVRRHVDERRALARPLLLGHQPIGDHLLAQRRLELPGVAPLSWIAVLEPENARGDVGRDVLAVRRLGDVALLSACSRMCRTGCSGPRPRTWTRFWTQRRESLSDKLSAE